ncbi:PadR family transcriptional regulator [Sphingomonas sp. Mn802worker]|uniref:PadR family transcriptional regulator n=1 Tax=Sphingomonas sp. Mn802worker TaxID=629773 RepID=UPI00035FCC2F|nr:PadR family transcriptional regulator [Sphingomonas sp. Mn802worker]
MKHHMNDCGRRWHGWEARLAAKMAGFEMQGPRGGRHGPFGGDWFARGEEPRGGRRARMFDGSELRLVLLKLIAERPRHGYDVIREIEALTAGAYVPSPGVVYPTLTLLDEMGLIAEQQSDGAKKRFAATDEGVQHLEERAEEIAALMNRLRELAAHRERVDAAPIRRAMGNLKVALGHTFATGEVSQDRMHEVAAMIDELAQKVERLKS